MKYVSLSSILFASVFITSCSFLSSSDNYYGNDYRIYKNTPLWDLAKAVKSEDIKKIRELVKQEKIELNYQEPKYGVTLLMLAVDNQNYNSCKTLLELGANPDIHDFSSGSTALIESAQQIENDEKNLKIFELLLLNRASPNEEETGERRAGNTARNSPMLATCGASYQDGSPLEKVKMLVKAGGDINYKNDYGNFPLREAFITDNLDVVLYLLETGAEYKEVIISRVDNKDYYICDELRFLLFDLDSKKYSEKMKIVDFLMSKGIDYRKTPIPDYANTEAQKLYPENWKEYLEKY